MLKTGFIDSNELCLHLEHIKREQLLDSYIETVAWFMEHESDQEPEQIVKMLNKKILDEIAMEANQKGLLKTKEEIISLL